MSTTTMLRGLLAGAAVASAAFMASPAAAYCDTNLYELTGWCNACSPIGGPYNTADQALHDKLPPLDCVA
jgi:hypothetical protein